VSRLRFLIFPTAKVGLAAGGEKAPARNFAKATIEKVTIKKATMEEVRNCR
jgi:hypothetical protein